MSGSFNVKGPSSIPLVPGHQAKMSPILSNGVNPEEVDEAIIRTIFLKNKKNELFIQQSPELVKRTSEYEDKFKPKDERRRVRFNDKLNQYKNRFDLIPSEDYREFGRKGFPAEHRSGIYTHLLGLDSFEAKYGSNYFVNCLRVDIPSSIGRVIQADIPRTLSAFAATCGSTSTKQTLMKMLRDVLWAFAVHKPEIGYCQSMNFIAAFFVSVFGCSRKAFYALVQLIDSPTSPYIGLHIPGYYSQDMSQLITDIGALEMMCRSRFGNRAYENFFEKREISNLSMIVSEWFHTLFITVFPIRTVLRIFDFLVSNSNGSNKVLFRISYVVLKTLISKRDELRDLDGVMQGHKKITKNWIDHNGLIVASTRGLRLFSRTDLTKWKEDVIKRIPHKNSARSHGTGISGITMMKLDEAIAPQTRENLAVLAEDPK